MALPPFVPYRRVDAVRYALECVSGMKRAVVPK